MTVCTTLHCTALTTLHCTALTTLHCTTLHCTVHLNTLETVKMYQSLLHHCNSNYPVITTTPHIIPHTPHTPHPTLDKFYTKPTHQHSQQLEDRVDGPGTRQERTLQRSSTRSFPKTFHILQWHKTHSS